MASVRQPKWRDHGRETVSPDGEPLASQGSVICYARIGLTPEVCGPAPRPNHALTCMVTAPRKIEYSDEKSAQVPADDADVFEQLATSLVWSGFRFGAIGLCSCLINAPTRRTSQNVRVVWMAKLGVYLSADSTLVAGKQCK